MLLVIDTGNTNSLFAIHDGSAWRAHWRCATDNTRTADDYAVWLSQLLGLQGLSLSDIDACIISNVVPQSLFHVRNLVRRYLHTEPLIVGENVHLDIEIRIDDPSEVGADRLVNAVGARAQYEGALLIIDSGTATTFDVIAADGGFEGGVIAPGINLSMRALHESTARLPRVAIARPAGGQIIGRGTVSAMQSGVYWGYLEMIDGLAERICKEYGADLKVIATGGIASLFKGVSRQISIWDPDVTIRGLYEIYTRHTANIASQRE